jgi:very-short-patch-repair endonuclease
MKGHNWGLCRKCGKDHGPHPRGMLGKTNKGINIGRKPWNKGKICKKFTKERRRKHKEVMNRPEVKNKLRKAAKRQWVCMTPKERTEHIRKMIEGLNRPEVRRKNRESKIGKKLPESQKVKIGSSLEKFWSSLTFEQKTKLRKAISVGTKKSWDVYSTTEKEKRVRICSRALNVHPNNPEKLLIKFFKKFKLPFKYTGDKPYPGLGGKMPDFVNEKDKQIIEYDGYAGHNPSHTWVPDNQPQLDDERDNIYHDAGYDVLRLLPKDLQKGEEFVKNKIKEWMHSPKRLLMAVKK